MPLFARKGVFFLPRRVEFKDINDLLIMIKSETKHNLTIRNEITAEETLRNYSYYTIMNGYKHVLKHAPPASGDVSFEHFSDFHIIDTTLNSIVLRVILLIEKSLKSRISHLIAMNYGVDTILTNDITNPSDYLCKLHYSSSRKFRDTILCNLKKHITDPRKDSPVYYYKNNKDNIPPWILAHNINLGESINWYKILVKNDKDSICNQMVVSAVLTPDEKKELFIKSFEILYEFRNKAAHGSVIIPKLNRFVMPYPHVVKYFSNDDILSSSEYLAGYGSKDFYSVLLAIFILLNDKQVLYLLVVDIIKLLLLYIDYDCKGSKLADIYQVPPKFANRLIKLLDFKSIDYTTEIADIVDRI